MNVPEDLLSRYMERRKRDLEACLSDLEHENFPAIEKVGHQLKGNGVTFGHPDLSSIGLELETAAAKGNIMELERALGSFSQWVNQHIN